MLAKVKKKTKLAYTLVDESKTGRALQFMNRFSWKFHTPKLSKSRICPPALPGCLEGHHLHGPLYIFRIHRLVSPEGNLFKSMYGLGPFRESYGSDCNYWVTSGDFNEPPELYDILKSIYRRASQPDKVRDVELKYGKKLNADQINDIVAASKFIRARISKEEYEALEEL